MSDLPICEFRGDPITITAPGSGAVRESHECYQMHLRGREEVAYVSAVACMDCGYSNAQFDAAIENYQQASASHPTVSEYADRWGQCGICEIREANFCRFAMGTCSLSRKLEKCDFGCPKGKFLQINRG